MNDSTSNQDARSSRRRLRTRSSNVTEFVDDETSLARNQSREQAVKNGNIDACRRRKPRLQKADQTDSDDADDDEEEEFSGSDFAIKLEKGSIAPLKSDKQDEDKPSSDDEKIETKKYEWTVHYDNEGRLYYYNETTDESTWEAPAEGFNPPEGVETGDKAAATQWVVFHDEKGQEYYYNYESGETSWDKPAINDVPADDEQRGVDNNESPNSLDGGKAEGHQQGGGDSAVSQAAETLPSSIAYEASPENGHSRSEPLPSAFTRATRNTRRVLARSRPNNRRTTSSAEHHGNTLEGPTNGEYSHEQENESNDDDNHSQSQATVQQSSVPQFSPQDDSGSDDDVDDAQEERVSGSESSGPAGGEADGGQERSVVNNNNNNNNNSDGTASGGGADGGQPGVGDSTASESDSLDNPSPDYDPDNESPRRLRKKKIEQDRMNRLQAAAMKPENEERINMNRRSGNDDDSDYWWLDDKSGEQKGGTNESPRGRLSTQSDLSAPYSPSSTKETGHWKAVGKEETVSVPVSNLLSSSDKSFPIIKTFIVNSVKRQYSAPKVVAEKGEEQLNSMRTDFRLPLQEERSEDNVDALMCVFLDCICGVELQTHQCSLQLYRLAKEHGKVKVDGKKVSSIIREEYSKRMKDMSFAALLPDYLFAKQEEEACGTRYELVAERMGFLAYSAWTNNLPTPPDGFILVPRDERSYDVPPTLDLRFLEKVLFDTDFWEKFVAGFNGEHVVFDDLCWMLVNAFANFEAPEGLNVYVVFEIITEYLLEYGEHGFDLLLMEQRLRHAHVSDKVPPRTARLSAFQNKCVKSMHLVLNTLDGGNEYEKLFEWAVSEGVRGMEVVTELLRKLSKYDRHEKLNKIHRSRFE